MSGIARFFYRVWPYRWLRSLLELRRGVRIHLCAELLAGRRQLLLGRRAAIGARTRIVAEGAGIVSIEQGAWLSADIEIQTNTQLVVGSGATIQRRCSLFGSVRIGRACLLAPNVFISSRTHPFRAIPHLPIREQERRMRGSATNVSSLDRPVWVQDDCWLGVNSVISPGVTLGKGCVVGANAVVTSDVAPYSVVAGIPARVIGARLPWIPPSRISVESDEDLVYVLAGCVAVQGSEKGRCIVVTADESLLVALAPTVRAIAVRCRASCNLEVEVGGARISVKDGENALIMPTAGLRTRHGALMFELTVVKAAVFGVLEVSSLESVEVEETVV